MARQGRIDMDKLRQNVQSLEELFAANPNSGLARLEIRTRLLEDVLAEASWSQYGKEFVVRCDEAGGRGGQGDAPSPLRYFVCGIAMCQQLWFAKAAALVDCIVEDLVIDLHASIDMRGEFKLAPLPGEQQAMIFDVHVRSPSTPERVLQMVDEGNSRSPLYHVVAHAFPIYERVVHNDALIRDTVPAHLA